MSGGEIAHERGSTRRLDPAPTRSERVLLACGNSLDREAISNWLRQRGGYTNLQASRDWKHTLQSCDHSSVDLLIADVQMQDFDMTTAIGALRSGHTRHLLVLDDCPREGRLAAVRCIPGVSYISRQAGAAELLLTLEDILNYGRRVFDPALAGRIHRTPRGFHLQAPKNGTSISQLSKRELEVMLLLAQVASVREAAQELNLSASTVDNHRSRLMKKLNVHKATELTRRAIRDGLLSV